MPSFLEVVSASPFSYEDAKSYTRSFEKTAFIISMVYVVVIFSTKAIMSNFKPFQLTAALNFWNAWLAIFSTIGSFITVSLWSQQCRAALTSASYTHIGDYFSGISGWFTFLFVMSKVLELGDTILIVLRKKPLLFLHW
ncbi:GNS1/SUR4 family protein [Ancylostoma duodenale]|uniref:Elongation of very long chain fatty acids protein n=1 Tax=Ancylostoma duodenale TaxID=51022 RepID=A0A0C2C1A4_9BILA|nr:GNS1/SUR4 family protein [Ancylostoma duodenale]